MLTIRIKNLYPANKIYNIKLYRFLTGHGLLASKTAVEQSMPEFDDKTGGWKAKGFEMVVTTRFPTLEILNDEALHENITFGMEFEPVGEPIPTKELAKETQRYYQDKASAIARELADAKATITRLYNEQGAEAKRLKAIIREQENELAAKSDEILYLKAERDTQDIETAKKAEMIFDLKDEQRTKQNLINEQKRLIDSLRSENVRAVSQHTGACQLTVKGVKITIE